MRSQKQRLPHKRSTVNPFARNSGGGSGSNEEDDDISYKQLCKVFEESSNSDTEKDLMRMERSRRLYNNSDNSNNTTTNNNNNKKKSIIFKKRKRMTISDGDDAEDSDNYDVFYEDQNQSENKEEYDNNDNDTDNENDSDTSTNNKHYHYTGVSTSQVNTNDIIPDSITINNHDDWNSYYNSYDTPIPNFPLPNYIHLQTDDNTNNNSNNNNNNNGKLSTNSTTISIPSSIKLLTYTDKSTVISQYIDNNQPNLLAGEKIKDLNKFKFSQKFTKKMGPYDDSLILHNNTFQFKVIHIENSKIMDVILSDCRTHQLYLINDQRLLKGWVKII